MERFDRITDVEFAFEREAAGLRAEMAELRGETRALAATLRGEMAELRGEMHALAAELRGEIRAQLPRLLAANVATMVALVMLVIAAAQLL